VDGEKEGVRNDPFLDPRIVEAEARHSRRRRRGAQIHDVVDLIFYAALLVLVIMGLKLFVEFVTPHLF
jgi:hypothetical protein